MDDKGEGEASRTSAASKDSIQHVSERLGLDRDLEDEAMGNATNLDIVTPSSSRQDSTRETSDFPPADHESDPENAFSGDEEEDDDEPKLKYQRLTSGLAELLKKDSVSCMETSDRFLVCPSHVLHGLNH